MKPAPLNVGIVGVGLIGGSLGMALRKPALRKRFHITGLVRKKSNAVAALKAKAVDEASTDARKILGKADVAVICIPVHKIVPFVEKNIRFFKKGSIITDVGSVKGNVTREIQSALRKRPDLHFVGGHPIAGSEKNGVENAKVDLFRKATCVLTKEGASFKALDTVRNIWLATGARCLLMSAAEHDQCLALTSHLPHLLAFALFGQVDKSTKNTPLLRSLVGGSFRDMTRIAGADPELWTGVISTNRKEIQNVLRAFSKEISSFLTAPKNKVQSRLTELARTKKTWK